MREAGARLVALWETVGISLPWPRTIALWELDNLKHYAALARAQYDGAPGGNFRKWRGALGVWRATARDASWFPPPETPRSKG